MRKPLAWVLVGVPVLALVAVGLVVGRSEEQKDDRQRALAPFYVPPAKWLEQPVGALLRREPLGTTIDGARSWRILYRSERTDGTPTVASGMVLAPAAPTTADRPVVAWAHGTVGLGDECAPSRSRTPLGQMAWAEGMLRAGMVVVATDYSGLGTPGVSRYLVGGDEARDVLNSVRAARAFPSARAGGRMAVYGHSQGGHAALWTASLAQSYAPEIEIVGVAAAAPAAELSALVALQDRSAVSWVIGPAVMASWPLDAPRLSPQSIVSEAGLRYGASIAEDCIGEAALEGIVLQKLGRRYFRGDPTADPAWTAAFRRETPPPLPPTVPVLVAQGLDDAVVLPATTALLEARWCAAGSRLSMAWLGKLGHVKTGLTAGPLATTWFQQRFARIPAATTCGTINPVDAAPGDGRTSRR